MELYDKKYVYFEWDDKLEGKKGFCGNSIEDLKSQVNYGNAQTGVLHHSNNSKGHPFVPTWSDGSGSLAYPFAYYDPSYEVKKAYNEGKKLQWKYRAEKDWNDWDNDSCPRFSDDTTGYELRVKPDDCETDNIYVKDGEMKSYSKDAEEFARKRVDYEMGYTCGMDFTEAQIEWIKDHIYTSVRNAYQSAVDKWKDLQKLQEMISNRCHIVSGNEGNRAYRVGSKEPVKDRYITNKELAMWLSKGNGQIRIGDNDVTFTYYCYGLDDDFEIDYLSIKVRKWEDDEWHEPTYSYCFGDK